MSKPVEVDYDQPRSYIIGGISVDGNTHFGEQQIISLTGLQQGMKVTIPSDDLSSVVTRLWAQKYFEDVALEIDRINAPGD